MYFVGSDPADGYMRLCASHHARYDGRSNRNVKLTVERVRLIKALVKLGVQRKVLAAYAGVTKRHLDKVLRGAIDLWRDVDDTIPLLDSEEPFADQCETLKDSKAYLDAA